MKDITLNEEMILWAVWRLKENAYGVTIRKQVSKATSRIYPYGTLYGTLAKLVRMGYVQKISGDPDPVRGGRSKNFYRITEAGLEALKTALKLKQSLWNDETESALRKG